MIRLLNLINNNCVMPRLIDPVIAPGSLSGVPQPNLEVDDRSFLRPWALEDVSVVVRAYSDPEIQKWIPYSFDAAEAEQVIGRWTETWRNETGACWAIAKKSDNCAFGRFAFQTIDLIGGSAEIAYWLLPQSRGEGYAPLATTAIREWAFGQLGLHRLELIHSVHNVASCRVATKAGFELEGILKSECLYRDGWHDTHLHARVRE
jgi:RimJ/RimL family protein N-acetyltransferase